MSDIFFSKLNSRLFGYFLDILYQFIIINDYLHFPSYLRQSKILSDINGRRTLRGPTDVRFKFSNDRCMCTACARHTVISLYFCILRNMLLAIL